MPRINSRGNMFSVMANTGFGALSIHKPSGETVIVPPSGIAKASGHVKNNIEKKLARRDIAGLNNLGVDVITG